MFSTNDRNIGIFGESEKSNNILLKNIVAQAVQLELPIFGINLNKILDSRFFKWQVETFIQAEASKVSSEVLGIDDESGKGETWINNLVTQAVLFEQSVLFINDCTPLLRDFQTLQYLGNLCANSMRYGLQVILVTESSRNCSQKVIKNLGNRFIVLPQFNPLN